MVVGPPTDPKTGIVARFESSITKPACMIAWMSVTTPQVRSTKLKAILGFSAPPPHKLKLQQACLSWIELPSLIEESMYGI
jgi:hypothetical protein